MSLRYCLRCKTIQQDEQLLFSKGHYYCPTCEYGVAYFGREVGMVSETAKHLSQQSRFVDSKLKDNHIVLKASPVPIEVLECEEIVLYNKQNLEALRFLASFHKAQGDYIKAKSMLMMIFQFDQENLASHWDMVDMLMWEGEFAQAMDTLDILSFLDEGYRVQFHKGLCSIGLGDSDTAYACFEAAKKIVPKDQLDFITSVCTAFI